QDRAIASLLSGCRGRPFAVASRGWLETGGELGQTRWRDIGHARTPGDLVRRLDREAGPCCNARTSHLAAHSLRRATGRTHAGWRGRRARGGYTAAREVASRATLARRLCERVQVEHRAHVGEHRPRRLAPHGG